MKDKMVSLDKRELIILFGKYGTLFILIAMIIAFSVLLPPFRSINNILNILGQTTMLSIFAAGMTCVLKMGDFDLSIGGTPAISSIVVASLLLAGYSAPIAIAGALLTGIVIGFINGFLIAYVGLSAFVCTLATMSITLGVAMGITKGSAIWDLPESFSLLGQGDIAGIPIRFMVAMCLLFLLWMFHVYTPTGRRMEAIGGNPDAARMSGIKVERNRLLGFVLCGFCASLAGVILTSQLMSANATQGSYYLLDAFGACFIGAATIHIGRFHIWGTFVGVLIVVIAVNGLIIMMMPSYLTQLIQGLILLVAILLSGLTGRFLQK